MITAKSATIFTLIAAAAIACLAGCSSDGNLSMPTTPSDGLTSQAMDLGNDSSHHTLWGWAELRCDTGSGTVELVPSREPALHLNVLSPVMATAGMSIAMVPGESDPPNGLFVMDISLTHPFAGKNKLVGFDVKGILITPGTWSVGYLLMAGPGETELLNRDGLTRWWNPTEFTGGGLLRYIPGKPGCQEASLLTARVNPFKTYADSLGAENPLSDLTYPLMTDDAGRAIFSAGTTNTRRYKIQFPVSGGPVVIFNYAIDASWNFPDPNPPVEVPDDFPINANEPEAFNIQITFPTNTLQYLEGGYVAGELKVQATVIDWQGLASGLMKDEINNVWLYAPSLLSQSVQLSLILDSPLQAVFGADLTSHLLPLDSADSRLLLFSVEAKNAGTYTQGGTTVGPTAPIAAFQSTLLQIPSVTCQADSNNKPSEAEALPFETQTFGTLCNSGGDQTDYHDYYYFNIAAGGMYGSIDLVCNGEPSQLVLYNQTLTDFVSASVSGGKASIPVGFGVLPGKYYIEVITQNENQVVSYTVSNNVYSNPCGDSLLFDVETGIDGLTANSVQSGRQALAVSGEDVWVAYVVGPKNNQAVYCRHSSTGGISFDPPVLVSKSTAVGRFEPSIALGPGGYVYCAWIDRSSGSSDPVVAASSDGGVTWGKNVDIYDYETGPLLAENDAIGILVGVDSNSRVHALWLDARTGEDHLYYSYSGNHGSSWKPAEKVDDSDIGIFGSPYVFDLCVSQFGSVFVVWTDERHLTEPPLSNKDIFFDYRGQATPWGTDNMVNPATVNVVQDYPAVTCDLNEVVYVSWADGRNQSTVGGPNPPNTWQIFAAQSIDAGAGWISEKKIPFNSPGYDSFPDMNPRIQVSPWGDPYVAYVSNREEIQVSKSCDGGGSWGSPVTAYTVPADCFFFYAPVFVLPPSGTVFLTYVDTRINPGPDHPYNNLFLTRSE